MKDLFILTADSDAQALMTAVLRRHRELRIRPISFEVQRFTGRDSGMVKEGPEIARAMVKKAEYRHLILLWDHHGSGWHRLSAREATDRIQQRLDGVTWTDRSAAIVVVPELEEWLWHCPSSVARYLGSTAFEFEALAARISIGLSPAMERCRRETPKELFEAVVYQKRRRRPLPEDFEKLGAVADLLEWSASETFGRLVGILRGWFPVD